MQLGFQNATYIKAKVKVAPGVYKIRLGLPRVKLLDDFKIIQFPFSYVENNGDVPNTFDVFLPNFGAGEKEINEFNYRMSRLKDCFKVPDDLNLNDDSSWVGREGKVRIEQDKKGFLRVAEFLPQ